MEKYFRLTFSGGSWLVDKLPSILETLEEGLPEMGLDEDYKIEKIQITEEEFNALPEFVGF